MPFDPHHQWLGIRPTGRPVNHYRLLGLDVFESDRDVIASAADRQMSHVRGFQHGPQAEASQQLLAEIAAARICLMSDASKEEYDEQLSRELLESGEGPTTDGAAFGEYLLVDQLAAASASTIYQAEHRTMRRMVALQTLTVEATANPEEVRRFRRKAAIMAKLEHANLITAYDAGIRDGVHCLVMELVTGTSDQGDFGPSLLSHLGRGKTTSADDVRQMIQWCKQAAAGLGHAHGRGVIHRRVAPSNLLLDSHGVVKVCGFGSALMPDAEGDEAPERPGATVGHIDYVAPEQLENSRSVDIRADIYGLGCTLAALLRRRAPYTGSVTDKILQHQAAAPPRLTAIDGVDAALEKIVHQMMAKSSLDRYATMYEVIQSLQGWLLTQTQEVPMADLVEPVVVQVRK